MTEDLDMTPILEQWLKDSTPRLSDSHHVFDAVGRQIHETPQQRRWWPLPSSARLRVPAASRPAPTRGFNMLSAIKFVLAAAFVALCGGFLLAGVLTTEPPTEPLPAMVGATSSPLPVEDPLGLAELERVGPGVRRLVDDGAGHSQGGPGYLPDLRQIHATADGGAWVVTDTSDYAGTASTPGDPVASGARRRTPAGA